MTFNSLRSFNLWLLLDVLLPFKSLVWRKPNFQHLGIERQKCEDLTFFIFQSKISSGFCLATSSSKKSRTQKINEMSLHLFRWQDATYLLSKWYIVLTRPRNKINVPFGGREENERNVNKKVSPQTGLEVLGVVSNEIGRHPFKWNFEKLNGPKSIKDSSKSSIGASDVSRSFEIHS